MVLKVSDPTGRAALDAVREPGLEVADLRFGYGGGAPVLDGISFTLAPGEVLCLLGPNGSGKTTLLRCLLGLERVSAGSIRVRGRELSVFTPRALARELAWVPQTAPAVFPFEAADVVLMGRTPHLRFLATPGVLDRDAARAAMTRLGIAHLAARPFPELSAGERQMVRIARALAQGSRVLLMDEPCAGLDYANQATILTTLRALARDGYSVLMSSHLPDHAFLLDGEVALLKHGRLRGPGRARDIITGAALSELYGTAMRVVPVAAPPGEPPALSVCVPLPAEAPHEGGTVRAPLDPDLRPRRLAGPGPRG